VITNLILAVSLAVPAAATPAATLPDPAVGLGLIDSHAAAVLLWQQAERDNAIALWNAEVERQRIAHEAWHAEQDRLAAEAAAREAAERAAQARQAPKAPRASQAPQQGSGRCGGNLPPCSVMQCESGGNIRAENPTSSASGKWQIIDGTWNGYGGYSRASDAPESVQDERAAQIYAGGRGRSQWVC
jgi:hypothetical protein